MGCNYPNTGSDLSGCCNDAALIKQTLVSRFSFQEKNIIVAIDEDSTVGMKKSQGTFPGRSFILTQLRRVSSALASGDTGVISFSGHGGRTVDTDGDEIDGQDETIYPADFMSTKPIVDDDITSQLAVAPGAFLFCIFDSCHSGTVCDLGWQMSYSVSGSPQVIKASRATSSKANGGLIVAISGCADPGTSADAWIDGRAQGGMTAALMDALGRGATTYDGLLRRVRTYLRDNGYPQVPQLTMSRKVSPADTFPLFISSVSSPPTPLPASSSSPARVRYLAPLEVSEEMTVIGDTLYDTIKNSIHDQTSESIVAAVLSAISTSAVLADATPADKASLAVYVACKIIDDLDLHDTTKDSLKQTVRILLPEILNPVVLQAMVTCCCGPRNATTSSTTALATGAP